MWSVVIVFLTCGVVTSRGQQLLTVDPPRLVAEAGQDVVLTCSSQLGGPHLTWKTGSTLLIHGINITAPHTPGIGRWYSVVQTGGGPQLLKSVLTIHNVGLEDAGDYQCEESPMHNWHPKVVSLVVLGGPPACGVSRPELREGDQVLVGCQLSSSGAWRPSLECVGPWGQRNVSVTRQNSSVAVIAVSVHLQLTARWDKAVFTCEAFFVEPSINPLPYRRTVVLDPLNVQYTPRNVTIHPVQRVYQPGDRVTCRAAGNPPPTYEWRDERRLITGETGALDRCEGATLLLTEHMVGHCSFSCVATNVIRGHTHHERSTQNLFIHRSSDELGPEGPGVPDLSEHSEGLCVLAPAAESTTEATTAAETSAALLSELSLQNQQRLDTHHHVDDDGFLQPSLHDTQTFKPRSLTKTSTTNGLLSKNFILPLAVAGVVLVVTIISGLIYWGLRSRTKQQVSRVFNLDNEMYLSTTEDAPRPGGLSAQPNQYAMAHNNNHNDSDQHPEKKCQDDVDDASSGFYSELVLPDEEPSASSSPTSPEPPALRPHSSVIMDRPYRASRGEVYYEDGYLMPTVDRYRPL